MIKGMIRERSLMAFLLARRQDVLFWSGTRYGEKVALSYLTLTPGRSRLQWAPIGSRSGPLHLYSPVVSAFQCAAGSRAGEPTTKLSRGAPPQQSYPTN